MPRMTVTPPHDTERLMLDQADAALVLIDSADARGALQRRLAALVGPGP